MRKAVLSAPSILLILSILVWVVRGAGMPAGQKYGDFITGTPLAENEFLVLGFMGGREHWDSDRGVRRLALKLRAMNNATVFVETVENRKRSLAMELIRNALDRNRDGKLDAGEKSSARLILYGQSFGGAAVVKLARQLKAEDIPVLLTVQVDSVGRDDDVIPTNVHRAANLFQSNGLVIRGEPEIRAGNMSATTIVGNFRYDYAQKNVDISAEPWTKKVFRVAHLKMERDPDVWDQVEKLILDEVSRATTPTRAALLSVE